MKHIGACIKCNKKENKILKKAMDSASDNISKLIEELEKDPSRRSELIPAYSKAVEYYSLHDIEKSQLYIKKIQELMQYNGEELKKEESN